MKSKLVVNIKKSISALIFTILISSPLTLNLLNNAVFAANQNVSNFDQLKNAVENANDGDVVILTSDITIPNSATAPEANYRCVLNCSKNITIKSASGQRYTIYHRSPDGILAILNGCTVNLENITIDFGRTNDSSNFDVDNTLIKLFNGSTLNLTQTTTLQNAYVRSGSPIYCENHSSIYINSQCTLTNLHTPYDGVIYLNNSASMFVYGNISNCSAKNGGAVCLNEYSNLTMQGNISNCTASENGGAIYSTNNSKITLKKGYISECYTQNISGGAVFVNYGELTVSDFNISKCHSNEGGGAIKLNNECTFNITDITISECHTEASAGGAMYIGTNCTGSISNPTITKCVADISKSLGGAIFFENTSSADTITIQGGTISECSAKTGGGIYVSKTDHVTVNQTSFSSNSAKNGGTIYCSGSIILNQVNISESKSTNYGDAVFLDDAATFSTPNHDSVISLAEDACGVNLPIYVYGYDGIYQANKMPPDVEISSSCTYDNDQPYQPGDWSVEYITVNYDLTGETTNIDPDQTQISLDGTTFIDLINSEQIQKINCTQTNVKFKIKKDGEHSVILKMYTTSGTFIQSDPISIKIDTLTPEPVKINSGSYSNVDTIEMYGTGEPGCTVTATDENNNIIGTSVVDTNGEWAITTSSMQDGQHTISVVQTDNAGNTSEPVSKDIIVDTIPPSGNIIIGSDNFTQFLNTITFGLLFTETTNVTISASDNSPSSGVKTIEYLKTDQVYSTITDIPTTADWQTDTISNNSISFDIDFPPEELNDKFFIYARITDNAENRTYIRSDGIIIYTDSAVTTDEISYTKLDEQDKDMSVVLNGNTISSITNGTNTLTKNTDYRIENNKIILRHEYLNSLAAGDYELTIHFAPAGETNLDPNLTLPSSTIPLYVEKANQQPPPQDAKFNNLQSAYTYGDNPGIISLNGGSGTGAVTYSSTNPEVATINSTTGEITILKAGTFEIIATKAADDNYAELIVTSDVITVNRRHVTITGVTAQNKEYDGNTNATPVTSSASIDGKIDGDDLSFTSGTAAFADKNVGSEKTVSFSGFALSGNDSSNYTLSAQPSDTTANITSKSVTITGVTAENKVYDGNTGATPVTSSASIDGVVTGDDLSFTSGSASFADKNVGSEKTVSFSDFALSGNDSSNYTLSAQPSDTTANITSKSVTITGVTAENKVYDGNTGATPVTSSASIDGVISGDDLSFTSGTAAFADKNVADGKTVSFSDFALSGNDSSNYTLSAQPSETTANITSKSVTITGVTAENKVYDGNTNATPVTSSASIDGVISGDDLSFTPGTAAFADKNVADGKTVSFSDFALSGNDSSNYTLSAQPSDTTANITSKSVTITGVTAENKVYDGNTGATPVTSSASIDGVISGDDLSFTPGTAAFADKNVADGKTVSFSDFALSGNDSSNYTLSAQPSETTANITSKSVTITGVTAENKVYDGNTNATPVTSSASIDGVISGDDLSFTPGTAAFADKNVGSEKTVSFSGFALSGNDSSNYSLSAQPSNATANITPKSVTISNIAIKDKTFDGTATAEFDGSPTLEGVAQGDNVILINGTPMFTNTNIGTNILIYFSTPFSLEGSDATNYSITQPSYNIYGNIVESQPSDDSSKDNDNDQTHEDNSTSDSSAFRNNSTSSPSKHDTNSSSENGINPEYPKSEDNIISGPFEAEDPATGIQVSAPEGVIFPWCILVIEEIYPNTYEYNETYEKLDNKTKAMIERNKLYEIHLEDQDGNIVQPDTSKGLLTVRIPVPNDYDLDDLEIYRINEGPDDDFNKNVVTVNNKNYCKYQTDHFSPYAMVDKNTTRDVLPYLILFLILLFVSLLIIIILKRRKDKEKQQ